MDDAGTLTDEALDGPPPRPGPGLLWLVALMLANTVAAVGLFGDISRHVSLAVVLDGDDFLAGWHLVLYGGVLAVGLILGAMAVVHGPRTPIEVLPAAVAGLVTLTVGGVTDAVWHEVYGIEAAFQALVSPPHLLILLGLVLLMVAPIGALATGPGQRLGPARSVILALSITSLMLVVSLFTGYLTPLIGGQEFQAGAYIEPLMGTSVLDYDTSRSLGVGLWFSVAVALVVTVVHSRCTPGPGTWTVAFGALALAHLIATGDGAVPVAVALVVYGVASDVVALRGRPHPLLTGVAVAAMWATMFAAIGARGELVWARELWSGVVATGFLAGAGVGAALRWVTSAPRDPAF